MSKQNLKKALLIYYPENKTHTHTNITQRETFNESMVGQSEDGRFGSGELRVHLGGMT